MAESKREKKVLYCTKARITINTEIQDAEAVHLQPTLSKFVLMF
jgi:hypothetical protein